MRAIGSLHAYGRDAADDARQDAVVFGAAAGKEAVTGAVWRGSEAASWAPYVAGSKNIAGSQATGRP